MVHLQCRYVDPVMATGWHMLLGGLPLLALSAAREGSELGPRLQQLTGVVGSDLVSPRLSTTAQHFEELVTVSSTCLPHRKLESVFSPMLLRAVTCSQHVWSLYAMMHGEAEGSNACGSVLVGCMTERFAVYHVHSEPHRPQHMSIWSECVTKSHKRYSTAVVCCLSHRSRLPCRVGRTASALHIPSRECSQLWRLLL